MSQDDDSGFVLRLPVTVIIPMRDAESYAPAAAKQLRLLTPQPEQIIVVLDGCRDGTRSAVLKATTGMANFQLIELGQPKGAAMPPT